MVALQILDEWNDGVAKLLGLKCESSPDEMHTQGRAFLYPAGRTLRRRPGGGRNPGLGPSCGKVRDGCRSSSRRSIRARKRTFCAGPRHQCRRTVLARTFCGVPSSRIMGEPSPRCQTGEQLRYDGYELGLDLEARKAAFGKGARTHRRCRERRAAEWPRVHYKKSSRPRDPRNRSDHGRKPENRQPSPDRSYGIKPHCHNSLALSRRASTACTLPSSNSG